MMYSKGPYRVTGLDTPGMKVVNSAAGKVVATMSTYAVGEDTGTGNAIILSKAPQMFELIEQLYRFMQRNGIVGYEGSQLAILRFMIAEAGDIIEVANREYQENT
jgi:hypothetical protein